MPRNERSIIGHLYIENINLLPKNKNIREEN